MDRLQGAATPNRWLGFLWGEGMSALGAVIRVGILWLLSLAVAIAGMEGAHRLVTATERSRIEAAVASH
jgi:hypothetical protein